MDSRLLFFFVIACAVSRIDGQTVTTFTGNITSTGCGTTKLCPTTCNVTVNASNCFFGSAQLQSNTTLFFELSGPTSGYVALGLGTSLSVGPSIVFVCGNNVNSTTNTSSFFFAGATNTSSGLTTSNVTANTVYTVQGALTINQTLNQSLIQCTFNTSTSLTVTKSSATTFFVYILSGTTSGTTLGAPVIQFSSNKLLDLSSPTGTTNTTNTNTTNTNTTSTTASTTVSSNGPTNPLAHALAILLSAMGLLLLY